MALEAEGFAARCRVPHLHRSIFRGAGQALAVRAEGHARDPARVALERESWPARPAAPHLYLSPHSLPFKPQRIRIPGIHAGAAQAMAVRAEGHAAAPM